MTSDCSIGYLSILMVKLYDIYPLAAVAPIVVIAGLLHYYIRMESKRIADLSKDNEIMICKLERSAFQDAAAEQREELKREGSDIDVRELFAFDDFADELDYHEDISDGRSHVVHDVVQPHQMNALDALGNADACAEEKEPIVMMEAL